MTWIYILIIALLLIGCPSPDKAKNDTELPINAPAPCPTCKDDAENTPEPTSEPSEQPTPDPPAEPTEESTPDPTAVPTEEPTPDPTVITTVEPTEIPTPLPSPIIIDRFDSYPIEQPPGGSWFSGCETSFTPIVPEPANTGVIVNKKINERVYLVLMNDIFGRRGTFGKECFGNSYAQIEIDIPAKGTIYFDYYHLGWNPGPEPSFAIEFFKNIRLTDIGNETILSDWSNNNQTSDFETVGISVVDPGIYKLTWRVLKNESSKSYEEDDIYIDNIIFVYD